jgi:hypothetical protein
MADQRKVTTEEGLNLARLYRCRYIETSALTGEFVDEAFNIAAESIIKINDSTRAPVRSLELLKLTVL